MTSHTVTNRSEAMTLAKELTQGYRTFWGTGNPCYDRHAVIVPNYFEYSVWLKPQGDAYNGPRELHIIKW